MPPIVHGFDWPDRIVVGTIGLPGSRSFYLQVQAGTHIVSVGLEKEQAALLAEKIDEILNQLMATAGNAASVPVGTPPELIDNNPLEQPVKPEFVAGGISLGWDPSTTQIVIEAYPMIDTTNEDEIEPPELLQVRIPVGTARAFVTRTRGVVSAGRPRCPHCGEPMEPDGHACLFA
ncbi:DUF3090 domain-containing protein [Rathayibacter toxicus]|uniref:DUF3090 domain-containing protein n=1 Tax=Rathayibacter toxicus TaxID=145458 RepID=A0A0C5BIW1_9MICO|nr:DUF3090 domain-containing protein [Rathayibacter toxicus]AJM78240.1 hypothetical protein TI83_10540 [Rathayibacter toxicus]ALS57466.1 hypothetical protein APU90_06525 [Rathayibacter toxicus]KKM46823.1 hypothetical protein VT73_02185 [Rathayibacter toxicus]PPG20869.1 DUF3090 domain-containing protein [Rathayibacter toxicus]PPG45972.1 DUF3090 domain-containing protein [Rathayibacter toxicus]